MYIRKYESGDCAYLAELFYNTVHSVNARDYTKEQLNVWATGHIDLEEWNKSFLNHFTVVAIENGNIVGFGDIDETGYLDRLYVHRHYQGKGVATALCDELETALNVSKILTYSSITARGFFEKRGYIVVRENCVYRKRILLKNYIMEKCLHKQ